MASNGLLSIVAGLLDNDGTSSLASAVDRLVDFVEADHTWSVRVTLKHNPRRAEDSE